MPHRTARPDPSRRHALLRIGALAALTAGCAEPPPAAADPARYRIPGEFEPTRAVWLGYDVGHADLTVALVQALLPHVKIRILASDEQGAADAQALLQSRGIRTEGIVFGAQRLSMYFLRDAAVFAVGEHGGLGVVDFRWNYYGLPGWCQQRHAGNPTRAAECAAGTETTRNALDREIARLVGAPTLSSDLFMEGGGIEVNGRGLIIANEALVVQRNPGRARADLERAHLALPGVRKLIWLPEGLAEDPLLRSTIVGNHVAWGTGGHTDEFVRFADERTVLLAWPEDSELAHPVARLNRQRMQRNFDILSRATDADGRPLRVIRLPLPRIIERRIFLSAAADPAWSKEWTADFFPPHEKRREGDPVMQVASASYLNFVVANGVVVVPDYLKHGTPRATQDRVLRLLEQAFPGRRIHFIDAIGANWVGGGPHCATLNEPLPVSA